MKNNTIKQSMANALAGMLAAAKRHHKTLVIGACLACSLMAAPLASAQSQPPITTVFYILLENRCFTSGVDKSQSNILFQNKNGASPYLTALCTPGSNTYTVTYQGNTISQTAHSSFCSCYHNVLTNTTGDATPSFNNSGTFRTPGGANEALKEGGSVHPSEPNYVFMEAGSNLSKYDDNDPYGSTASVAQIAAYLATNPTLAGQSSEPVTGENLCALLQNAGISWTSYTEGTCLLNSDGQDFNAALSGSLTNNIAPLGTRTVPFVSFSGNQSTYTNAYNGTHQYNFATKHTGSLFFPATNGSTTTTANTSPSNVEVSHYEPLEQLAADLAGNTQSQYCVITPDQYNDGHTALSSNFVYNGTTYTAGSDLERVAQMDNFCSIMVPQIMNSPVYQSGHAAIVIWTDETEGSPNDDYYHTLLEIVISPYCKGNAYNSTLNFTHSSDLATMQEIFGVVANTSSGYLNDAANFSNATQSGTTAIINSGQGLQNATGTPFFGFGTGTARDLSDLFVANTIPSSLPGLSLTPSGYAFNRKTNTYTQTVTVTNVLSQAITSPIYLVVGSPNATVKNSAGTTANFVTGSPYVSVSPGGLAAGASLTVTLQFAPPSGGGAITDTLSTAVTAGTP